MADKKFTQLTELATTPSGSDLLCIVDVGTPNVSKKITVTNLLSAIDLSAYLNKDGSVALTGNWDVGDTYYPISNKFVGRDKVSGHTYFQSADRSSDTGNVYLMSGNSSGGASGEVHIDIGTWGDIPKNIYIGEANCDLITIGHAANDARLGATPTGAQSLAIATTGYVDTELGDYLKKDGTVALTGDWDIGDGRKIIGDRFEGRTDDGGILITTPDTAGNQAGAVTIQAGEGTSAAGWVYIKGTDTTGNIGGAVQIKGGDSSGSSGGNIQIYGGQGASGGGNPGGSIDIQSGDGQAGGVEHGYINIRTYNQTLNATAETITLSAPADNVLLAAQPTGGTDLAVATTNYVDTAVSGKISALVDDTTPQLGGDLDMNSHNIIATNNVAYSAKNAAGTSVQVLKISGSDHVLIGNPVANSNTADTIIYAGDQIKFKVNGDSATFLDAMEIDDNGNVDIFYSTTLAKTGSHKYELPTADNTWTAESEITATVDTNSVGLFSLLEMASDGNFDEADADAEATSDGLLALALETGTGSKRVMLRGFAYDTAWSWTVGQPLYISTTVGTMTQTAPSGSSDIVRKVGIAMSANLIYFNPSLDYTEIV